MLFASRTLTLRLSPTDTAVPIEVFGPETNQDGGWFCHYTIGWPHETREATGWGVDSIQAVELTLRMIGSDIYTSPYHTSGKLVWMEPGKGYGFPVPTNLRDLLIGDDALYL